jgi:hypothetical protein
MSALVSQYAWVLYNPLPLLPYAAFLTACFALSLSGKSIRVTTIFMLLVVFFVGFRWETGFDWPVYKRIFNDFRESFNEESLLSYQNLYRQEALFLWLMGMLSRAVREYEIAQAVFSAVFVGSIIALARVVGANAPLAATVSLTFLLPSVAFSTVRQSLALAFFNFGVVAILRRHAALATVFFCLAILSQVTACIYVGTLILIVVLDKAGWKILSIPVFLGLSVVVFLLTYVLLRASFEIPELLPAKVGFYFQSSGRVGWWLALTLLLAVVVGLIVSMPVRSSVEPSPPVDFVRKLIIVLASISAGTAIVPIANERAFYGTWMLFSAYICAGVVPFRTLILVGTICTGVLLSVLMIAGYPSRLMFVPYQNYLVGKLLGQASDAEARARVFYKEHWRIDHQTPSD